MGGVGFERSSLRVQGTSTTTNCSSGTVILLSIFLATVFRVVSIFEPPSSWTYNNRPAICLRLAKCTRLPKCTRLSKKCTLLFGKCTLKNEKCTRLFFPCLYRPVIIIFATILGLKLCWGHISKKRVYQCFLHSFRLDSIPAPWYNTAVRNLFLGLNQNIL